MTIKEMLTMELQFIQSWTNYILQDIDEVKWGKTMSEVNTNIHWILGHIVHDNYWHAVGWVTGPSVEFDEAFDIKRFEKYFKKGSDPSKYLEERPALDEIINALDLLNTEVLGIVQRISEDELENKTLVPSPVAKTKYESLMFAVKHQSWHYGQIAMIKRILKNHQT